LIPFNSYTNFMQTNFIPVITIDGPGGSGKGTLSRLIAKKLGWGFLESGALYRVLALATQARNINIEHLNTNHLEYKKEYKKTLDEVVYLAQHLAVSFKTDTNNKRVIFLNNQEVTDKICTESCGERASKIAIVPPVRAALLERQRAFLMPPGLVADGRDMGTVVFPEAKLKIFLEAL